MPQEFITPENLGDYSYIIGAGTVEHVSTENAPASAKGLSLELFWPRPGDNRSGIEIILGTNVADIAGWSNWIKAANTYTPNLVLFLSNVYDVIGEVYLDNYDGENYSSVVYIDTSDMGDNNWHQMSGSDTLEYRMFFNDDLGFPIRPDINWGQFKTQTFDWYDTVELDYSNAVVEKFRISNDGIGTGSTHTAYLDDFTFGATDYIITPTQISVSDSGAGAEATPAIKEIISVADTGSGADATPTMIGTIPVTDLGLGADIISAISAVLSIPDSGSGADVLASKNLLSVLDVGAGADVVSTSIVASIQDVGVGVERIYLPPFRNKLIEPTTSFVKGVKPTEGFTKQAKPSDGFTKQPKP